MKILTASGLFTRRFTINWVWYIKSDDKLTLQKYPNKYISQKLSIG